MAEIRKLNTSYPDFQQQLETLLAWEAASATAVNDVVPDVIAQIRARGDAALIDFTNRFDGWEAKTAADLEIPLDLLGLDGDPGRTSIDDHADCRAVGLPERGDPEQVPGTLGVTGGDHRGVQGEEVPFLEELVGGEGEGIADAGDGAERVGSGTEVGDFAQALE